jgi:hypothetical protein
MNITSEIITRKLNAALTNTLKENAYIPPDFVSSFRKQCSVYNLIPGPDEHELVQRGLPYEPVDPSQIETLTTAQHDAFLTFYLRRVCREFLNQCFPLIDWEELAFTLPRSVASPERPYSDS